MLQAIQRRLGDPINAVNRLAQGGIFVSAAAGNSSINACKTSPAARARGIHGGCERRI
jgi:hypothetical protein